jgi:hypothetical protein
LSISELVLSYILTKSLYIFLEPYFVALREMGKKYGSKKIYNDFVKIYDKTSSDIDKNVLDFIDNISKKYDDDKLKMNILFTILYAGMVAEENKERAILKKRIKRLGMHQILLENMMSTQAASYSKRKEWYILDDECKERGF